MSAVGQGEPNAIGDKHLYRFEQKVPIQVSKKSAVTLCDRHSQHNHFRVT